MYVCGIRSEVAGREHRGVGEDSRFNSRFIFKRTRREISLFLARTTFWRGTGLQGVIQQGSTTLSLVLLFAPSLLFWVFLFYWPVRLGWRRIRGSLAARKATTLPVQP